MTDVIKTAAKRFARFLRTPEGRLHLAQHGLAGEAVIVCHEAETVKTVLDRAREYDPPVALAIHFDSDRMLLGSFDVVEVDGDSASDCIDPSALMGMVAEAALQAGGDFRFRMTKWDPSLEVEDLTTVI